MSIVRRSKNNEDIKPIGRRKPIGKKIFYVSITLVVATIIYGLISEFVFHNDFPLVYKPALVLSGSMEPTISTKDLAIIKKAGSYAVNDIVVFKDESDNMVMHRVVDINNDTVITKGDANNSADDPISRDKIIGIYSFKIPLLGKIIKSLKTPLGLPVLSLVMMLVVFLPDDFIKRFSKVRNLRIKKVFIYGSFIIGLIVISITGYYSEYKSIVSNYDTAGVAKYAYSENLNIQIDLNGMQSDEKNVYIFDVSNNHNGATADINLYYNIRINTTNNLPLTYKIKCMSSLDTGYGISDDYVTLVPDEESNYGLFTYGAPQTHEYELVVEWDGDDMDSGYTYEVDMVDLEINFVQKD